MHRAVTTMFSEYAVLYSRIAGQTTKSFPPTMTVEEGADIGTQATRFINELVTSLLGQINSTKVHRLLCHVCECVRLHGNLKNGNTSMNETMHKEDKAYYLKTNKNPKTITFQLVRQAQGSRSLLAKLDAADRARVDERAQGGAGEQLGGRSSDRHLLSSQRQRVPRGMRCLKKKPYHLKYVPVGKIARRPGLSRLSQLLGLHVNDKVRSVSQVAIEGAFDCGGKAKQLLRCAEEIRGSSWYDSIIYKPTSGSNHRCVGEVRAIIRQELGYAVVVMEMAPVDAEEGCPLAARGCQRLRWQKWDATIECALRAVPLERVIRVVHVVPDFANLAARRGFGATPAARDAPLQDRIKMRYWLNAFYPWEV